jgi:hypothetical protein
MYVLEPKVGSANTQMPQSFWAVSTAKSVRPVAVVPANVVCPVPRVVQVSMVAMDPMVNQETLAHPEIPSQCVPNTCANSPSSVPVCHQQVPMVSQDVPATLVSLEIMVPLVEMEMLAHVGLLDQKDPPATTEIPATLVKLVVPVSSTLKSPVPLVSPEIPEIKVHQVNPASLVSLVKTVIMEHPVTRATLVFPDRMVSPVAMETQEHKEILDPRVVATIAHLLVWHLDIDHISNH